MKKKSTVVIISLVAAIVVAAGGFLLFKFVIKPLSRYNDAVTLSEKGEYKKAVKIFKELGDYSDSKQKVQECIVKDSGGEELYKLIAEAKVGQNFTIGTYEQDADEQNGAEPIVWKVLERDGNKILLTTATAIEAMAYSTEGNLTWNDSDIRKWLNEEFLPNSFTAQEQEAIIPTHLEPVIAEGVESDAKATDDKIFLMSSEESKKYFLATEKEATEKKTVVSRQLKPTKYAISKNIYNTQQGYTWWWLRDVSMNGTACFNVRSSGIVTAKDNPLNNAAGGVRPVMWIGADY